MENSIVPIVEGHGEVGAVPVLLRRLMGQFGVFCRVHTPIRVRAQRFVRNDDELQRYLELANRVSRSGLILVLLDLDDGCPATDGPALQSKLKALRADLNISVVMAYREFESWFIHARGSLAKAGYLVDDHEAVPEPDAIRGAKGWIERNSVEKRYSEVLSQPALSAAMSLEEASSSRSFRKLMKEVGGYLGAPNA